jgi:hypothetical protein
LRWFDPNTQTLTPFPAPGLAPDLTGDTLGHIGITLGELSVDDGHSVARMPLFDVKPPTTVIEPSVLSRNAEGWVLVSESAGWGTYNVVTGERRLLAVPPRLPEGLETFDALPFLTPVIDFDGGVLLALRNAVWAAAFRFDPLAGEWQQLGRRLAEVDSIGIAARAGSYVIGTHGNDDLFMPRTVWSQPQAGELAAELLNSSTQVLRPSRGVTFGGEMTVLTRWVNVTLAPNGKCVAYWEPFDGSSTLNLLALEGGETRPVPIIQHGDEIVRGGFDWVSH